MLAKIARASRDGATLATYTCAGWVRRGLQQAGFAVERVEGFGRKREMVRGSFDSLSHRGITSDLAALPPSRMAITNDLAACCLSQMASSFTSSSFRAGVGEHSMQAATRNKTPRTALIIGGGIAGCAAAHALVQRGISVTLVERAPRLATAASGNPRGILHARFGAGDNPLHRFVLASYGHALALFDEAVPVDGVNRAECGLLQLACNEVEKKRISRLTELNWPAHLMQFVDAVQASELAGVGMTFGGLWFPAGGWVVPPRVCGVLASDARITQRLGHDVEILEETDTGWRLSGREAQGKPWSVEAGVVLVCCAHAAKKLAPFAHFPLTPVRGQVTIVPETACSKALQSVVCGDGYCAPAVEGVHVAGATHAFDDESTAIRATDHAENLANLAEYAPCLHQALGEVEASRIIGRASVRCSAPGSMPLVGKVQTGLYCSLAHGTRGLLTAGLAGEVLAAQICGQLPPLPKFILAALDPISRIRING